jgi:hypothetical protein
VTSTSLVSARAALRTMIASRAISVLLALALLLSVAAGRAVASAPLDQAASSLATITILEGRVSIIPVETGTLRTAISGEWIYEGDRVLTGSPGGAILTFLDGSELELGDSTEILVQLLRQTDDGSLLMVIGQALGNTVSRVNETGDGGRYEIVTPSTTIVVRGTVFRVEVVLAPGTHRVARESVAVELGSVEVRTTTGVTVVRQGERLDVISAGSDDPTAPTTTAEEQAVVTEPDDSGSSEQGTAVADGEGGSSGGTEGSDNGSGELDGVGNDDDCGQGALSIVCEIVSMLDGSGRGHENADPSEQDGDAQGGGLLD